MSFIKTIISIFLSLILGILIFFLPHFLLTGMSQFFLLSISFILTVIFIVNIIVIKSLSINKKLAISALIMCIAFSLILGIISNNYDHQDGAPRRYYIDVH